MCSIETVINDIMVLGKIMERLGSFEDFKRVFEACKDDLKITSKVEFYAYKPYVSNLANIEFEDFVLMNHLSDPDYCHFVEILHNLFDAKDENLNNGLDMLYNVIKSQKNQKKESSSKIVDIKPYQR